MDTEKRQGIWLEVSEVRLERDEDKAECRVRLKADKEEPKAVWWPVKPTAASSHAKADEAAHQTYKAILNELDKKRLVLAEISLHQEAGSGSGAAKKWWLECRAFRFQTAELGSR
jgi:hypothetical protein